MRVSRRRAPGGRSYFSPPESTSSPSSSSSPTSAAGVTVVVPRVGATEGGVAPLAGAGVGVGAAPGAGDDFGAGVWAGLRSEEHTSELQSLMRNSYAVFCLIKKQSVPSAPLYHSSMMSKTTPITY